MNKEMKGWRMEGRPVLLPDVDGDDKEVFHEWCLLESLRAMSPFHSRAMHRVSMSSSFSPATMEHVSKVRKNSAISQRAMTERHTRWSRRDWNPELRQREGVRFFWPAKALQRRSRSETRCAKPIAGRLCEEGTIHAE